MRPTLQNVIERAWNEIANLPDGEKPKVSTNQLAIELARVYERGGHTLLQFEQMLKADIETLLFAYSFALRKIPHYWNAEHLQRENAYSIMAGNIRYILTDLLALTFDMGLCLPQDELKRYEGVNLWVQDIKPLIAPIYGGNTDIPLTNPFCFELKLPKKELYLKLIQKEIIYENVSFDDFIIHIKNARFSDIATSKVSAKRLVLFFANYVKTEQRKEYEEQGATYIGVTVADLSKGNGAKIERILQDFSLNLH